jgi:membrane-associated phospholipid phosphatase
MHFLSDVLVGALLGGVLSLAAYRIFA